MLKKYLPVLVYFSVILYTLANPPLVSDEFAWILSTKDMNIRDLLIPKEWFLIAPVEHYLLYIWYHFFDIYNLFIVNLFKAGYIFLSFYLVTKFFTVFLSRQSAYLASFLFIFFPSHDSTVFCLEGIYATLTIAFYLYSFYLAYNNRLVPAFIMALLSSFTSYASVPVALSLFVFFVLNKELKKGIVVLTPNVLYSLYYIFMSKIMHMMKTQIPDTLNIHAVVKQFILQVLTFADAMFGPSMWLKIYYAFFQLSFPSIIIGAILTGILYKTYQGMKIVYNRKLVISLIVLMLSSFVLFAITGMYPQLAFNLGNRTTIYGSLLLAYLIVLIPAPTRIRALIFGMLLFVVLGISDHWKGWNVRQQQVIANIKNSQDLKGYNGNKIVYVSGNQFSEYGPISHIEFFSEDWVISSVFRLALKNSIPLRSINRRHKYIAGYLVDTKYNLETKVSGYINIYDSEKNRLFKLKPEEINRYIESLPADRRHWIQMVDVQFIKNLVNRLMPRLRYAL